MRVQQRRPAQPRLLGRAQRPGTQSRGLCVRAGEWAWVPDLAALAPAMGHSQCLTCVIMCCCCPAHGHRPTVHEQRCSHQAAEKSVAFNSRAVYQLSCAIEAAISKISDSVTDDPPAGHLAPCILQSLTNRYPVAARTGARAAAAHIRFAAGTAAPLGPGPQIHAATDKVHDRRKARLERCRRWPPHRAGHALLVSTACGNPRRTPGGVGLSVPQRALLPLTTKSARAVSGRKGGPAVVTWCDPHMQLISVLRGTRSRATLGKT